MNERAFFRRLIIAVILFLWSHGQISSVKRIQLSETCVKHYKHRKNKCNQCQKIIIVVILYINETLLSKQFRYHVWKKKKETVSFLFFIIFNVLKKICWFSRYLPKKMFYFIWNRNAIFVLLIWSFYGKIFFPKNCSYYRLTIFF